MGTIIILVTLLIVGYMIVTMGNKHEETTERFYVTSPRWQIKLWYTMESLTSELEHLAWAAEKSKNTYVDQTLEGIIDALWQRKWYLFGSAPRNAKYDQDFMMSMHYDDSCDLEREFNWNWVASPGIDVRKMFSECADFDGDMSSWTVPLGSVSQEEIVKALSKPRLEIRMTLPDASESTTGTVIILKRAGMEQQWILGEHDGEKHWKRVRTHKEMLRAVTSTFNQKYESGIVVLDAPGDPCHGFVHYVNKDLELRLLRNMDKPGPFNGVTEEEYYRAADQQAMVLGQSIWTDPTALPYFTDGNLFYVDLKPLPGGFFTNCRSMVKDVDVEAVFQISKKRDNSNPQSKEAKYVFS